jgi:hypothetical protein
VRGATGPWSSRLPGCGSDDGRRRHLPGCGPERQLPGVPAQQSGIPRSPQLSSLTASAMERGKWTPVPIAPGSAPGCYDRQVGGLSLRSSVDLREAVKWPANDPSPQGSESVAPRKTGGSPGNQDGGAPAAEDQRMRWWWRLEVSKQRCWAAGSGCGEPLMEVPHRQQFPALIT